MFAVFFVFGFFVYLFLHVQWINNLNVLFYLFKFQVMLGIITMVRATPWSPTEFAWLTTCCSTMASTERWRYMYVKLLLSHITAFLVSGALTCPPFVCFSVRTKPAERRWPSITAMITSNSCVQFDRTTCQSTANKCRDVSFCRRGCLCRGSIVFNNITMAMLWLSLCRCLAVNVGEDCPVFDGLFEFCQLSGGGSVGKLFLVKYCSDRRAVLDSNHAIVASVIC